MTTHYLQLNKEYTQGRVYSGDFRNRVVGPVVRRIWAPPPKHVTEVRWETDKLKSNQACSDASRAAASLEQARGKGTPLQRKDMEEEKEGPDTTRLLKRCFTASWPPSSPSNSREPCESPGAEAQELSTQASSAAAGLSCLDFIAPRFALPSSSLFVPTTPIREFK